MWFIVCYLIDVLSYLWPVLFVWHHHFLFIDLKKIHFCLLALHSWSHLLYADHLSSEHNHMPMDVLCKCMPRAFVPMCLSSFIIIIIVVIIILLKFSLFRKNDGIKCCEFFLGDKKQLHWTKQRSEQQQPNGEGVRSPLPPNINEAPPLNCGGVE